MSDYIIEYINYTVDDALANELTSFWELYRHKLEYLSESFELSINSTNVADVQAAITGFVPSQPIVIARDASGEIIGVVTVIFKELDESLGLGSFAYFQRMFVVPEWRSYRLTNQLYKYFIRCFLNASDARDYRAGVLISDNLNPGLQTPSVRRYFARLGFEMLGSNSYGGEVWMLKLVTRFLF